MRLLIRIFSALLIAIVVLVALVLMLPGEKLAALATDQVEAQTGRKLEFHGKVGISIWPVLGVTAQGVTLSNADWAGPEPMLTSEQLSIGIAPLSLLSGDLRITEITAVLPELNLSENEAGVGNWVLQGAATPDTGVAVGAAGASTGVHIDRLTLTGAALRYQPNRAETVEVSNLDLSLQWPDPTGPAQIDMTVRPADQPVAISAEVGQLRAFLAGEVASVGATISTGSGMARFDGNASLQGAVSGRLSTRTQDTIGFLAGFGHEFSALPEGFGQAVVGGADLTYTPDGRLALRDLSVSLDDNQFDGAMDVVLGETPKITAQLSAGALRFPGLADLALSDGSDAKDVQPSGWSHEVIDASVLAAVDAIVLLNVKSLETAGISVGESTFSLGLERARAVLKLQPARVFGGILQGELVANNRSGLSLGGKLAFDEIELSQTLGQTAGYDRLNGRALGEIEYLAVGNTQDALMRSLSGKGWFEVGKGFFTGFDLEQLMRRGEGNGGSTVFDQLTGSYVVEGGNLQNDDLLLTVKQLKVEGQGRVGLGAQDLDYMFKPTALALNGGEGLTIPIRVTGPWSDPKIRPDLQEALQPEIDAIEEQTKDHLRQKLSEELETEVAPEADLNDVLRERLEQEAREQLLKLLGAD